MNRIEKTIRLLREARVELIQSKELTDIEQIILHEHINTVLDELEKTKKTVKFKNCIECGTLIHLDGSGWCVDCHPAYRENRKYLIQQEIKNELNA